MRAQLAMAPRPKGLRYRPRQFDAPEDARRGSVLVPLCAHPEEGLQTILTLRSAKLKHHNGQLSFPGGGMDEGETPEMTALREAREEIGLPADCVEIIGELSPLYIPPSNNLVRPVVGVIKDLPSLRACPIEVDEILNLPVSHLLDPHRLKLQKRVHRGVETEIPFWDVHRIPLWGATAMMMAELTQLIKEFEEETGITSAG